MFPAHTETHDLVTHSDVTETRGQLSSAEAQLGAIERDEERLWEKALCTYTIFGLSQEELSLDRDRGRISRRRHHGFRHHGEELRLAQGIP